MSENFQRFGRSGCKLHLTNGDLGIRKVSSSKEYNDRLRIQCKKQSLFQNYGNFAAPDVYGYDSTSTLHYFDMEYIHGRTFEKFCTESGASSVNTFAEELALLIHHSLSQSIRTYIDVDRFAEKLRQLRKVLDGGAVRYLDYLHSTIPTNLLIGPTHGDLTMSNIVFSDKYYLLDFLDNIYDTPLIDLVKVKQDTEHKFFLNFVDGNRTRVETCLNYIDKHLNKVFADVIQSSEFTWLSIFNLLRVLPYLTNQLEKNSIINSLQNYEHIITSSR